MTIYSDTLMWKFEIAALDLPIPDNLLDQNDQFKWSDYASYVSPARLLEKFGQALDEFHIMLNGVDLANAPEGQKIKIYSKWQAAAIASFHAAERFGYSLERGREGSFRSDMSVSLFYVTDLLQQTGSPLVTAWEKRAAAHREVENDESFIPFLNYIHRTYISLPKPEQSGPGIGQS